MRTNLLSKNPQKKETRMSREIYKNEKKGGERKMELVDDKV